MNAAKLQVGQPILSWCTSCKSDQPHAVFTLKTDGTLNKVKCNTCGVDHVYRKPKTETEERKPSGTKRKKSDGGAVTEAEASKAKPYGMDTAYQPGDVIEHARFGFGRVLNIKPGGKMEVSFTDGTKIMVCRDVGLLATRRGSRQAAVVVKPVEVEVVEEEAAEDIDAEPDEAAPAAEGEAAAEED